jgi:hypothetical protein
MRNERRRQIRCDRGGGGVESCGQITENSVILENFSLQLMWDWRDQRENRTDRGITQLRTFYISFLGFPYQDFFVGL